MESSKYGIEEATSNRSKCIECRKDIVMGELRMYFETDEYYSKKRFYCAKCAIKILTKDIKAMIYMQKRLISFVQS